MGDGDGCTKYDVLNATELYILTWSRWKFDVMCILPQLKLLQGHNIGRIGWEEVMIPSPHSHPRHTWAVGVIYLRI